MVMLLDALSHAASVIAPPPPPPFLPAYGQAWATGLFLAGIKIEEQRARSNRPGPTPPRVNRPRLRMQARAAGIRPQQPYRKPKEPPQ